MVAALQMPNAPFSPPAPVGAATHRRQQCSPAGPHNELCPALTSVLRGVQDRFQQLVPVLDKCGAATVGLTLLAIGVLGLLEARHQEEGIEQLQPVTASGPTIPSGECIYTWRLTGTLTDIRHSRGRCPVC